MFEKVNPSHPDKIADRIAGALVDLAYSKQDNPKIAVELTIGHGRAFIITETSVPLEASEVRQIVNRISREDVLTTYVENMQDWHLAHNQAYGIRCGDNGIFKGMPISADQQGLTSLVKFFYKLNPTDGKYIQDGKRLIICQSNMTEADIRKELDEEADVTINPLGEWTGGINVDTGAVNRKLGSDMGDGVTGGGLHGKDLSKADVSVNIYTHLKAQKTLRPVEIYCAIGDDMVDGRPYSEIVEIARNYIKSVGGFEKFAEWGLIR